LRERAAGGNGRGAVNGMLAHANHDEVAFPRYARHARSRLYEHLDKDLRGRSAAIHTRFTFIAGESRDGRTPGPSY
jgi:hypothetical protein